MSETKKRRDYISWDEYFMGVADLSGRRSKDPNTQVGACIVSQDNKRGGDDRSVQCKIPLCDAQRAQCDFELSGRKP